MIATCFAVPASEAATDLLSSTRLAWGAAGVWWPIWSSKPAGRRSPALGRFDSFAASSQRFGLEAGSERRRSPSLGLGLLLGLVLDGVDAICLQEGPADAAGEEE